MRGHNISVELKNNVLEDYKRFGERRGIKGILARKYNIREYYIALIIGMA